MKYDVLIKGGNLFLSYGVMEKRDIGIIDGKIAAVKPELDTEEAEIIIEAGNKLITPALVDSHIHLDKAYTVDEDDATDLLTACKRSYLQLKEYYGGWNRESIIEDMMERGRYLLKECIKNGTLAVRTNCLMNKVIGTAALEAAVRLRKEFRNKLMVQVVAACPENMEEEWKMAASLGWIDVIGGYPNLVFNEAHEDYRVSSEEEAIKQLNHIFELAKHYQLPIDLHLDFSEEPDTFLLKQVSLLTLQNKMQQKVTCSHVTNLDAKGVNEEQVADAIAWCSKAGVMITTLTSEDMYLMSEKRRGATRVRQLRDAGVVVATASDNIRDSFRPFGNCDLLEEALLTAQVHKFGTDHELTDIMRMITYFPALECGIEKYGLLPGADANLVIFEAPQEAEAIRSQVKKSIVMCQGRIVAMNHRLV